MYKKNAEKVSILLEGILPIIGYLFWKWNIAFVIFYYLFEFVLQEILFQLKLKKIILKPNYFNGEDENLNLIYKKNKIRQISLSILTFIVICIYSYLICNLVINKFDITQEFNDFFWYKELGIPQGFILIPLFIFVGYSSYKIKFLLPKLYIHLEYKNYIKNHSNSLMILIAIISLFFVISYLIKFPEWFYIVCFSVLKIIFEFIQKSLIK